MSEKEASWGMLGLVLSVLTIIVSLIFAMPVFFEDTDDAVVPSGVSGNDQALLQPSQASSQSSSQAPEYEAPTSSAVNVKREALLAFQKLKRDTPLVSHQDFSEVGYDGFYTSEGIPASPELEALGYRPISTTGGEPIIALGKDEVLLGKGHVVQVDPLCRGAINGERQFNFFLKGLFDGSVSQFQTHCTFAHTHMAHVSLERHASNIVSDTVVFRVQEVTHVRDEYGFEALDPYEIIESQALVDESGQYCSAQDTYLFDVESRMVIVRANGEISVSEDSKILSGRALVVDEARNKMPEGCSIPSSQDKRNLKISDSYEEPLLNGPRWNPVHGPAY